MQTNTLSNFNFQNSESDHQEMNDMENKVHENGLEVCLGIIIIIKFKDKFLYK